MVVASLAEPARAARLFQATLNGSQEVPAQAVASFGAGSVLLNDTEDQITVNLNFTSLTSNATAAHIHGAADPGVNAAILFPLAGVPAATSGTLTAQVFSITPAQVAQLKAGQFYFNLHSANFPGGEIRGQILGAPNDPWTTAASTGTVDEDSLSIVRLNAWAAGFDPFGPATGTVTMRYHINATNGVSRFCPADFSAIAIRYRNSDPSGATAHIVFTIRSSSLALGNNTVRYTFDSSIAGAPSDNAFHVVYLPALMDFDFANNVYWIEATIFRGTTSALANLGTIQIWESNGAACQ